MDANHVRFRISLGLLMTIRAALACLVVVAMALASSPSAHAENVVRLEITEYGIYALEKLESQRDADGVLWSTVSHPRHVATTTTVTAAVGVQFGFRFRLVGASGGQAITLRTIWVYPAGGLKSPQSSTPLQTRETSSSFTTGEIEYTGYKFDDSWELVPGVWKIQIWDGDRKLGEQSFTVIAH